MSMYIRAATVASDLPEGSWGSITGSYESMPPTIVWATRGGGTTVLANANYLNLTNGLSGNQLRFLIEDCDSCVLGLSTIACAAARRKSQLADGKTNPALPKLPLAC